MDDHVFASHDLTKRNFYYVFVEIFLNGQREWLYM